MKKARLLLKFFLSLWIVYNIFVMLIMPNVGNYLGRTLSRFITPYAALMGLNAGWNFFSPDPAHTMYLEYTLQYPELAPSVEKPMQDLVEGVFPPQKNLPILNPLRKRDLYAARFMALDPKRLRVIFAPWLCRQNPGVSDVEVRLIVETVPPLDKVVQRPDLDLHELSERLEFARESIACDSLDEEIL